ADDFSAVNAFPNECVEKKRNGDRREIDDEGRLGGERHPCAEGPADKMRSENYGWQRGAAEMCARVGCAMRAEIQPKHRREKKYGEQKPDWDDDCRVRV